MGAFSQALLAGLTTVLLVVANEFDCAAAKGKPQPGQEISWVTLGEYKLLKDVQARVGCEQYSDRVGGLSEGTLIKIVETRRPISDSEQWCVKFESEEPPFKGWLKYKTKEGHLNMQLVRSYQEVASEGTNPALIVGAVIVGAVIAISVTFAMNKRGSDA